MSDRHIKDIDREILPVFVAEVAEFLDDLSRETSVLRVSKRIEELDASSRLVGASTIAARTSNALAAIAQSDYIDLRVVMAVRELTEDVVLEAQEASLLAGIEFTGAVVELRVDKPPRLEKPWWQVW